MEAMEREYNLLDEPWIRVLRADSAVEQVSLTDVFLRAHTFVDLAGELAAQDMALLRLLLAVLHTVFSRVDQNGAPAPLDDPQDAFARWEALWARKQFPQAPIRDYLQTQHGKFWLFDPQRPFWQVPAAACGTAYTAAKLDGALSESSNKARLFPMRAGQKKEGLTYAEAARWLLYINGFDDTSSKPKQKNLPSPGVGWLGKLGLIAAQGDNLFETLMLNLTLVQDNDDLWEENVPAWELENARAAERMEIECPDNPAALLTLQSRRLLLQRNAGKVTGYTLLGGDFFERENALEEQMTVWRKVPQKNGVASFVPKLHNSSRQMWRDFASIAAYVEGDGQTFCHWPGVVTWIGKLRQRNLLVQKDIVRFRIAGVQYGTQNYFVVDEFSDSLPLPTAVLIKQNKNWNLLIQNEVNHCDAVANIIGKLAANLAKAAGSGNSIAAAQQAKEQFYTQIDLPFRAWICTFKDMPEPAKQSINENGGCEKTDGESCEKQKDAWCTTLNQIAAALGKALVQDAGKAAFVGRFIQKKTKENGKEVESSAYICAPDLFNKFQQDLKKL